MATAFSLSATSTGGLTNKYSSRIGDTPSFGAGFWAEEWVVTASLALPRKAQGTSLLRNSYQLVATGFAAGITDRAPCVRFTIASQLKPLPVPLQIHQPIAMRNTLHLLSRMASLLAVRSILITIPLSRQLAFLPGTGNGDSFLRLSAAPTVASLVIFCSPRHSLRIAMSRITAPHGQHVNILKLRCVCDRTWVNEEGKQQCMVFRDEY